MTPSQPTTPSAVLEDIAERLAAATGPDFELGRDVYSAVVGQRASGPGVPHITASLDAVLSLVEAKLPGWHWEVGSDPTKTAWASLYPNLSTAGFNQAAPTPALALLRALVAALAAQSTGEKENEG